MTGPSASSDGRYVVRATRADDWRALRAIRLEALLDSPDAYGSTYHEVAGFRDERWKAMAVELRFYLAERDGVVVGMASGGFNDRYPGTHWLYGMYVTPVERGTGVAVQLVDAVVDWALADGARELFLQVTTKLERSHHFYEKMGFSDTGESQTMHRDAHLELATMRRDLAEPLFRVREVEGSSLVGLRRKVLKDNDPEAIATNPLDDDPATRHFGGFVGDRLVASASFFLTSPPRRPDLVSYQLRYMAVDFDAQGHGYGARLLDEAQKELRASGVQQLWANARDSALGFYLATGWSLVEGSEHLSAESGLPHTKITRLLVEG